MTLRAMIRLPSAFAPIVMSMLAVLMVVLHVARFGLEPQPDETGYVHLWQLLMVAQVPVVAFFALRRFPEAPKPAALVLALQGIAFLAALAPVILLES